MTLQDAERRRQQSERDREAEQDRRDHNLHDEARLRPRAIAGRAEPRDSIGAGHNRGPPLDDGAVPRIADDHRVLSFRQWCELNGFPPMSAIRSSG
jgi:hypothetical protein